MICLVTMWWFVTGRAGLTGESRESSGSLAISKESRFPEFLSLRAIGVT